LGHASRAKRLRQDDHATDHRRTRETGRLRSARRRSPAHVRGEARFVNPEKRRMGMVLQTYATGRTRLCSRPSLVFVARGLPAGSRFFAATMVQIDAELEESARIHGVSWTRTFVSHLDSLATNLRRISEAKCATSDIRSYA